MREARRSATATVLFTDLVGSTELLTRLGEAAFDDLRRAHFAAVREAVERSQGDEVKTLGDGVLAVFASASDAVACAVATQQATDRQARRGSGPLAVRVGLALGDVGFEEDDVFGVPVVEAARLVAAASGGQILATSLVRAVAGARTDARFVDVGPLSLKGLPGPVTACEVAWDPLPASDVPLPSLLLRPGQWVFVGREPELERLERVWKEAAAGESRLVLVGGEPGVGKTRLASELARRVHHEGATVLAGRCDEDLGVPFQPFVEALRHYLAHAGEPHLGRHGGELVRLVPELAERPGLAPPLSSDPETERYRLYDAVVAWLADAAVESPVFLVLDDLHWAARPTLLLLRHIVRSSDQLRLLILGTYRDTEPGPALTELLADLRRDPEAARLALGGLDEAAVEAFVEGAIGDRLLAPEMLAETEGNPFFLGEVIRHVIESGEHGVPEGVREVVDRRVSRLSEAANQALRVAGVAGAEVELAVLQRVAGLDEEVLLAGIDEALAARLLIEAPGAAPAYRFSHALVRAALYDQVAAGRRAVLHRRVGEALEAVHAGDLDDHLPALAHHYGYAAGSGDSEKAAAYATRAGDRALVQLAHDEAVRYYRQALNLLPAEADDRRQDLLIALGEAQRRAGHPEHRETLLDAARLAEARGDGAGLAKAALANSRGTWWTPVAGVDSDRVAALESALAATAGNQDAPLRARLLANLGVESVFAGDRAARVAWSDEALAIARRLNDAVTTADVLFARFRTIAAPSTLAERRGLTAELLDLAGGLDDPVRVFGAWALRRRVALESGDIEQADQALAVCEGLAAELGQPTLRWTNGLNRVGRALLDGALDDAERILEETTELGLAIGQRDATIFVAAAGPYICLERGRPEAAETLAHELRRRTQLVVADTVVARVASELGRKEEARRILDDLGSSGFALPFDMIWLWGITDCAAVATDLPDRPHCEVLLRLLAPYADQFATVAGASIVGGSVSLFLGMLATALGRFEEAEQRFTAAAAVHARMRAPLLVARTRLEEARMRLARRVPGDPERARELLQQVLATSRELGAEGLERKAAALLA